MNIPRDKMADSRAAVPRWLKDNTLPIKLAMNTKKARMIDVKPVHLGKVDRHEWLLPFGRAAPSGLL